MYNESWTEVSVGGTIEVKITIAEVSQYVNQEVTMGVWLANKRSSGKNSLFLQLRDGSGFIQGVVVKEEVGDEIFQKKLRRLRRKVLYT
ncbi:hypothetical protein GCM10020331_067150 [Ectobacillus funiculus]